MERFFAVVQLGLAAGFIAAALRTWEGRIYPPFVVWWAAKKQRKPLGCPVCMGFWTTTGLCAGAQLLGYFPVGHGSIEASVRLIAAMGLAAWLNGQLVHVFPEPLPLDELLAQPPAKSPEVS